MCSRVEEVKKNPATARDTAALSQHVTSYLAILVKKYLHLQLLNMAASFVKAAYYYLQGHTPATNLTENTACTYVYAKSSNLTLNTFTDSPKDPSWKDRPTFNMWIEYTLKYERLMLTFKCSNPS